MYIHNRMPNFVEQKTDRTTRCNRWFHYYSWILQHPSIRSIRQKISKDIVEFNSIINHFNETDIYRILHLTRLECTFLSSSRRPFTKIGHIPGHKTCLKFKRIEIMQCMLSDHNGIKLKISKRKIAGKSYNTWRLDNTFLNEWVRQNLRRN